MNIKINEMEVKNTGKNIKELSQKFSETISQLNSLIDEINDAWNGIDSKQYIETIKTRCVPGLEKVASIIDKYGTFLEKVPSLYGTVDTSYINKSKKVDE